MANTGLKLELKDLMMLLGIASTLATAAFGYGQLTQKVDGIDHRLTRMEDYLVPESFRPIDSAGSTALAP